jgi:branched-chain amino acid transport system permease protein
VAWQSLAFQIMNGLVWSVFVALIALGLNAIYGLLGILNIAHGAVYAAGAILAWYVVSLFDSFWLAFLVVPVIAAAGSIPVYKAILRLTIGKDMMVSLLATSGLLFMLTDAQLALFGGAPRTISPPITGSVALLGFHYPLYRFVAAAIAAAILLAFWGFLRFTSMGVWIRSVEQSPTLAKASGVPVERVYLTIVALSAFFAALAGVLAAPMTIVHYQMGMPLLGAAFIVIVVGGLGNMAGAVAAAAIIGVARGVLSVYITPTYAEVAAIVLALPILVLRPNGLFGGRS